MNYLEIIALIDSKDRKGWEQLYTQYGKKFYGFAVDKWHFNDDEAWDTVYLTLQTIILKISEYEIKSQGHFDNLIFKIFTNFLRQQYRKNKAISDEVKILSYREMNIAEAIEDSDMEENIQIPYDKDFFYSYLTENDESENVQLKALQAALAKLDPIDRDLLLLKANNYSYDQIAEMLNIENSQLKVKHYRAKNKLIKLLQPK